MATLNVKGAGCVSVLVAAALYLNTLDCGMVYDDEDAIERNQDLRPHTPWSQLLVHDFWGTPLDNPISHKSYRPLCVATFRLNYLVHGLEPMGYHLVNVVLHAVVCYLYVQLCGAVFTEVWPALIAGLLFAAHPIHTEAVAGIVGRAELLSAVLFLAAVLIYQRALSHSSQEWLLVTVSTALSVLAMLSKEQGITAIPLCLVYDFIIFNKLPLIPHKRNSQSKETAKAGIRKFFRRGIILCAAASIAVAVRLIISNGTPSRRVFSISVNPPLSQSTPYRQLSWLYLVFVNAWLLLCPSPLSMDWRYGAVPLIETFLTWNNIHTLVTFATLTALILYALHTQHHHHRTVLFALALMILPFLPASNLFFPVGFVVAERVLYLPSMGFCMLVGLGVWMLLKRLPVFKFAFQVGLSGLLLLHVIKAASRNREWYSSTTIHEAGVRFNPRNPILLSNLGIDHALQEDYMQAEILYLSSMKHYSTFGSYYNYGLLMKELHRYKEAEKPLLKALELATKEGLSQQNIANTYDILVSVISVNSSRLHEALQLSNRVLTQHPNQAHLYTTRCSILIKLNWTSQFIQACEQAVRSSPGYPTAHYYLGVAYSKLGYLGHAETCFRNMLSLDKSSTVGMSHLATILQTSERTQDLLEAKKLWRHLATLEPNNTEVLMSLASVETTLHHYTLALDALHSVLQVDPSHIEALYKAGQLLYRRSAYSEAVSTLERLSALQPNYMNTASLLKKAREKTEVH